MCSQKFLLRKKFNVKLPVVAAFHARWLVVHLHLVTEIKSNNKGKGVESGGKVTVTYMMDGRQKVALAVREAQGIKGKM